MSNCRQSALEGLPDYAVLFELAPEAFFVTDASGTILEANEAAGAFLLSKPQQLVSRLLIDYVQEKERRYFRLQLCRLLEMGRLNGWELTLQLPIGRPLSVEVNTSVVETEGQEDRAILWLIHDVSERKRIEQAQRAVTRMEAASAVAGEIAHDFNDLMVSVLGNTELLQMQFQGSSTEEGALADISQSARQAVELAQQMLSVARGESRQVKLMNLNDVIRETFSDQASVFGVRISVERRLEPELWEIEADPLQMRQVLLSLCRSITAQWTEKTLSIVTHNVQVDEEFSRKHKGLEPGPCVCASIKDMSEAHQTEALTGVLEPFFSSHAEGRKPGFAMTYNIVKNHKGYLSAYLDEESRITFDIYLPARKAESPEKPRSRFSIPSGVETVLLIDDEEMVLKALKRILSSLGYRILIAHNGEEAIEIAQRFDEGIHLAILDLGMPVMGGVEAFPLLRRARPDMRIIVCSGYELDTASQGLLDMGAQGFIQKPFELQTLARGIRNVLDN